MYLDELNATARELETLQKQREELNDWDRDIGGESRRNQGFEHNLGESC